MSTTGGFLHKDTFIKILVNLADISVKESRFSTASDRDPQASPRYSIASDIQDLMQELQGELDAEELNSPRIARSVQLNEDEETTSYDLLPSNYGDELYESFPWVCSFKEQHKGILYNPNTMLWHTQ